MGIAEVFSAELLEAKGGLGAHSDLPVFVVGMPRSGTTLVEQIIASHPMAHGAGELKRLHALIDADRGLSGLGRRFDRRPASSPRPRLPRLHRAVGGRAGGVADKMPSNFLYCGVIRLILPDARIIHCRRDPVDTCLSCYTKLFSGEQDFTYDQRELGQYHRAYQSLMAHWRATLPASHFLEVDYEAMVDDLERPDPAPPRIPRLALGRRLPALPRDPAPRANRERQPGPPADLLHLRRPLAAARRATATAARGARGRGVVVRASVSG